MKLPELPINLDGVATTPGEYKELQFVFQGYTFYCHNKARALELRLYGGDIDEAIRLERECDEVYEKLPEWARW